MDAKELIKPVERVPLARYSATLSRMSDEVLAEVLADAAHQFGSTMIQAMLSEAMTRLVQRRSR